ncbi:fluoride efflux transporter FluC [Actinospongicola halichondriae]|uniref:fluoride efflux transporter FluC n=1 Tax=Actinospongicola halichondriae TaxID=3236844 RepID=UPI003D4D173A
MITIVGFVVAASLGASTRHLVRIATAHRHPIPVGTLAVNLAGSFVLGVLAGWDPPGATVVGTAGVGALTTFSTFSAEVVELRAEGRRWVATYVVASVGGGVALAWFGLQLA